MKIIKNCQNEMVLYLFYYKNCGYIAEAINNYLLRLGWSYGDEEIFSLEYAQKIFSLERIGKSPARFDNKRLDYLNNFYIKKNR